MPGIGCPATSARFFSGRSSAPWETGLPDAGFLLRKLWGHSVTPPRGVPSRPNSRMETREFEQPAGRHWPTWENRSCRIFSMPLRRGIPTPGSSPPGSWRRFAATRPGSTRRVVLFELADRVSTSEAGEAVRTALKSIPGEAVIVRQIECLGDPERGDHEEIAEFLDTVLTVCEPEAGLAENITSALHRYRAGTMGP